METENWREKLCAILREQYAGKTQKILPLYNHRFIPSVSISTKKTLSIDMGSNSPPSSMGVNITYIRTIKGFCYLHDYRMYSRKIVGTN
jgi:hypothetical protein